MSYPARVIELALRFSVSNKFKLCDRIAIGILYKECRPLSYKDNLFKDCHALFYDTMKSKGITEAFRIRYEEKRCKAIGIIPKTGFLYLKDWKYKNPLLWRYPSKEGFSFSLISSDWEDGVKEYQRRRPYIYDKSIPEEIRQNGFVAEYATKRILMSFNDKRIIDKEHHHVSKYNDHDFRLVFNGAFIKMDAKSKQSNYGWNAGASIKNDVLYIFTSRAENEKITLYGFRKGSELPKNGRILLNDMYDINYLFGWLSYNRFIQNLL